MKPDTFFIISLLFLLQSSFFYAQEDNNCVQTLNGEIRDKVTDSLLQNARIVLKDAEGAIIAFKMADEQGKFSFDVDCDTDYTMKASMVDYTAEHKNFSTSNENNLMLKFTVHLDKGKIDFVTDPVLKSETIEIVNVENDSIELASIEQLRIVSREEMSIPQNNIDEEIVKPENQKRNLTVPPIYFDLGSSYFDKQSKKDLYKVVLLLRKHPSIKIQLSANSDAQGTSDFNQWLSDRRAKRIKDYLISRGIDQKRITSESFGDTRIINRCLKGVDCDEDEHAVNRRVEFTIVKI